MAKSRFERCSDLGAVGNKTPTKEKSRFARLDNLGAVSDKAAEEYRLAEKKRLDKEFEKVFNDTIFKVEYGRLPNEDEIARRMGYRNAAEQKEYKKNNPELYAAMGGIKYDAEDSLVFENQELSRLKGLATNRLIMRFKNYDTSELSKIIDTLNTQKWQNADTMKKYSDKVSTYVNDYVALNTMGYFNSEPDSERKVKIDSLKEIEKYVNSCKDVFSNYKNSNDYSKIIWAEKYGSMTFEELEAAQREIEDNLYSKSINKNSTYSSQELDYVKNLLSSENKIVWDRTVAFKRATKEEQNDILSRVHYGIKRYDEARGYIKALNKSTTKEEKEFNIKEDIDEYISFVKNWYNKHATTDGAREAYGISKGYVDESGNYRRGCEDSPPLLDYASTIASYETEYGSYNNMVKLDDLLTEYHIKEFESEEFSKYYTEMQSDSKAKKYIEKGKKKYKTKNKNISEEEYDVVCYYLGKGKKDDDYFTWLKYVVREREVAAKSGWSAVTDGKSLKYHNLWSDYTEEAPLEANIASVLFNLGSGIEFTYNALNGNFGENKLSKASSEIRGAYANTHDLMIGNYDIHDFLYGNVMSFADSLLASSLFGEAGSVVLAGSAAASGYNDALNRGLSEEKALGYALFSGFSEWFFEEFSIAKFEQLKHSNGAGVKTFLKNIGKSMLSNASEEALTEIANTVYDTFFDGDLSNYELSINKYLDMGFSEKEAKLKTALDLSAQVAESAAGGALMGVGFGAIGDAFAARNASEYAKYYYGFSEDGVNALIENGLAMPDGSSAKILAAKAESKIKNGKNLSGTALYELAESIKREIATKSAVRLAELGENEKNIKTVSPMIAELVFNGKSASKDRVVLNDSKYANRVIEELSADSVNTIWINSVKKHLINSTQLFNVDLSQVDEKYRDTYKRAMESEHFNNTRYSHDFIEMVAKISSDKGITFDFTDNKRMRNAGIGLEDKTVNAYITDEGVVTINAGSPKFLNSVIGHEITHILENTKLYNELANVIVDYAKSTGDYDSRLAELTEIYANVNGADINKELIADLVGDYLFTDEKFIRRLFNKQRNLFQRIYDEIKYLCGLAGPESKEKMLLEKVKNIFENVYLKSGKNRSNKDIRREFVSYLEKTELYDELADFVVEYAQQKGEYQSRKAIYAEIYKNMENADVNDELIADLICDYLFTDSDFVEKLYNENSELFLKIYDEIKSLYSSAISKSKEKIQLEKVKNTFEKVYRNEAKTEKNTAENGSIKYSISKTSQMPYREQLRLIEKRQMNGSNSLYIGNPSEQLQNAGISDMPFAMNQSDYRKSRRKFGNDKNYSAHAVPYEFFEKMPQYFAEAPMLIDNAERVSVITSYSMKDTKGQDSYIIGGVWANQKMESDTVNLVKSVYPLDDFKNIITSAAEAGKLVIVNKNKAEQMLDSIGIQHSEGSHIVSLARESLSQTANNVNDEFLSSEDENTELYADKMEIKSNRDKNHQDFLEDLPVNEYNKLTVKESIQISAAEEKAVESARTKRYDGLSEEDIPVIDVINLGEYNGLNSDDYYFIRNADKLNYSILKHSKTIKGAKDKYANIRNRQTEEQDYRGNDIRNENEGLERGHDRGLGNNGHFVNRQSFGKNVELSQKMGESDGRVSVGKGADNFGRGDTGSHNRGTKTNERTEYIREFDERGYTDEFKRLQAESQGMADEQRQLFHSGDRTIDESLRGRLSRILGGQVASVCGRDGNGNGILKLYGKGSQYNIYEEVNGKLFHDCFEIVRNYLKNGELVDLHTVKTTEGEIGYDDCCNYLSEDGLSGFAITPEGDIISVFNASGKNGFLRAISSVVKEKAKTLDCYDSSKQPLRRMYEYIFGFKTASIMDYNMEYDHDNIAENHSMPKIAFMVNTEENVETRNFAEDEYDAAKAYRDSFADDIFFDGNYSVSKRAERDIDYNLKSLSNQPTEVSKNSEGQFRRTDSNESDELHLTDKKNNEPTVKKTATETSSADDVFFDEKTKYSTPWQDDLNSSVSIKERKNTIQRIDKNAVQDIENICKKLGLKAVFEDLRNTTDKSGKMISPDGYIKDGIVHLSLYAKNPVGFVLKHEITHFGENTKGYKEFVRQVKRSELYNTWICEKTNESDVKIAEYVYKKTVASLNSEISEINSHKAEAELIADFAGDMLFTDNGSKMTAIISDVDAKHRNAFVQFIIDVISYIKKKLSGNSFITFQLSVLEDSYNRMLSEAVASEKSRVYGQDSEVSYCFAICKDDIKIKAAEQMEADGEDYKSIFRKVGLVKDALGNWLFEIENKTVQIYPGGNASTESHFFNNKLKWHNGVLECKLKDIIVCKELYYNYPELRNIDVIIKDSDFDDRIKYQSTRKILFINKRLLENYTQNRSNKIRIEFLGALQRIIQHAEGRNSDINIDKLKEIEENGQLPYTDLYNRKFTAREAKDYIYDNYEVNLVEKRERTKYLLSIHHSKEEVNNSLKSMFNIDYDNIIVPYEDGLETLKGARMTERSRYLIGFANRLINGENISLDEINSVEEFSALNKECFSRHKTYRINTEARSKIRQGISRKILKDGSVDIDDYGNINHNGGVKRELRADIVIGLPYSEKSEALVNSFSYLNSSRIIDADMAKEWVPEYDNGLGTTAVDTESRKIAYDVMKTAVKTGENITYRIIGEDYKYLVQKIQFLKRKGYNVNLHLDETSNGESIGYSLERYMRNNIFLPPKTIAEYENKPSENFEEIIRSEGLIDGYSRSSDYEFKNGFAGFIETANDVNTEIDNYTEAEYNSFGWAICNKALSIPEYKVFASLYLDYKNGNGEFHKTSSGETILYSKKFPKIIMYVKGTLKCPEITGIVRLGNNITIAEMSDITGKIINNKYEKEKLFSEFKVDESDKKILNIKTSQDCDSYQQCIQRMSKMGNDDISSAKRQSKSNIRKALEPYENSIALRLYLKERNFKTKDMDIRGGKDSLVANVTKNPKDLDKTFSPQKIQYLRELPINKYDSVGRRYGENCIQKNAGTCYKNENGELTSLYFVKVRGAGSFEFSEIGLVAGTLESVKNWYYEIVKDKSKNLTPTIVEIKVNISNPLILDFTPENFSPKTFLPYLLKKEIISQKEFDEISNMKSAQKDLKYDGLLSRKIREIIKNAGFDGIAYLNNTTDVGSVSTVIFDEESITWVAENGILNEGNDITEGYIDLNDIEDSVDASANTERIKNYSGDLLPVNYNSQKNYLRKIVDDRISVGNSGFMEHIETNAEDAIKTIEKNLEGKSQIPLSDKDTAGNNIKKEASELCAQTIFKNDNGSPLSFFMYFSSVNKAERLEKAGKPFASFNSIFNSWRDARIKNPTAKYGVFMEYYINSLGYVTVNGNEWNSKVIADKLLYEGIITKKYYSELFSGLKVKNMDFDGTIAKKLVDRLIMKNIDCVILVNENGETKPIVFDDNQIIPVSKNGIHIDSENSDKGYESTKMLFEDYEIKKSVINSEKRDAVDIDAINAQVSNETDNTQKMRKLTEILMCKGVPKLENADARIAGNSGIFENDGSDFMNFNASINELKKRNNDNAFVADTDTVGRTINENIKERLKDSIFKDNNGRPISFFVYNRSKHGNQSFDKNITTVFSTLKAAHKWAIYDRKKTYAYKKSTIEEVYVIAKNPYNLALDPGELTPAFLAEHMYQDGTITQKQYESILERIGPDPEITNSKLMSFIYQMLKAKGYDCITYVNEFFDSGSKSIIVFNQSQYILVASDGLTITDSNLSSDYSKDSNSVEKGSQKNIDITKNVKYNGKREKKYANHRPEYAKDQILAVWNMAIDAITGKVYDPTGEEIIWDMNVARNGQWDMGHIPDEKYSEMHKKYMNDEITEEEFEAWYQDPNNYRPELPSTNRSHKYE